MGKTVKWFLYHGLLWSNFLKFFVHKQLKIITLGAAIAGAQSAKRVLDGILL